MQTYENLFACYIYKTMVSYLLHDKIWEIKYIWKAETSNYQTGKKKSINKTTPQNGVLYPNLKKEIQERDYSKTKYHNTMKKGVMKYKYITHFVISSSM